ncbi:MAG: TerB family tellurite resistance protein [Pseudomonadota bacterium]
MHRFLTALVGAILIMGMATPADARRGAGAEAQSLIFVSPTEFDDNGTPLALCHLVNTHSAIMVNFWRTLEGYALATDNCATDQYYEFSNAQLAAAQAAGMVPATIPSEPKMSAGTVANGFWGWGLVIAVLAFAGLKARNIAGRTKQRQAMMSDATPAARAVLDVMCHAAKADGFVADSEVQMIKSAAEQMTGAQFDLQIVKQMAKLAEETLDKNGFKRLIKGRTRLEMLDMMRAVLMVAAADGRLDGKEKHFVGGLAQAMQMDGNTVGALLQEVVGGGGGAEPQPA